MTKQTIEIPRVASISKQAFYKKYVKQNKPLIIENLTEDWLAPKQWDFDYLKNNFPNTKALTIDVKNDTCNVSLEHGVSLREFTFKEAFERLQFGKETEKIAIAMSDKDLPEALKNDYSTPMLCEEGLYLRARVFISGDKTVTKIHQDLFENIYCMVKGSKKIHLYEPNEHVYPYSRFSKLPNHAHIDPENIDFNKYPKMKNAKSYFVELKEGESLYLPSMWWHHLRGVGNSIALSYWWANGWKIPVVWAAIQYKNLRGI